MTIKEKILFRLAARIAASRALDAGKITRRQRGRFVRSLYAKGVVEEMADVCLDESVERGIMTAAQADSDENVDWVGLGENIDWECLSKFILTILPMFI